MALLAVVQLPVPVPLGVALLVVQLVVSEPFGGIVLFLPGGIVLLFVPPEPGPIVLLSVFMLCPSHHGELDFDLPALGA